jgi:protein-disulfide isomerase
MSKRQEIRERRRKQQIRSRVLIIIVVAVAALFIAFVLILPSFNRTRVLANAASVTVTPITPRVFKSPVNGVHLGNPNAPVKIDVWEDFQCSSCLSYTQTTEPQVLASLVDTGKVYYTFHFFPFIETLSTVPNSESHQAASAALCAADQGRFWDYHDILFANWIGENSGSYTDTRLVAFAKALNLNMTQFNQCFQSGTHLAEINQDYAAGQAKGVTGTPSLFVNGTIVAPGYVPTFDQIQQAVTAALPK